MARGQSDEVMILTLSCIDLPRLLQALKTINVQRRALHGRNSFYQQTAIACSWQLPCKSVHSYPSSPNKDLNLTLSITGVQLTGNKSLAYCKCPFSAICFFFFFFYFQYYVVPTLNVISLQPLRRYSLQLVRANKPF